MIRFSRFRAIYIIISLLVIIPGIISLLVFGLRPSIDFTGGTLLEISFSSGTKTMIEESAQAVSFPLVSIQQSGQTFIIRAKPEGSQKAGELLDALQKKSESSVQLLRNETVGPVLGRELLLKAFVAAVVAVVVILLYIAHAFKNLLYGISAIVALLHDLLVTLGIFSLLGAIWGVEIDTLFITALLTTMSFSVHDTIVVFDRIREITKRGSHETIEDIADIAVTQTMARSLANSVTIIIMLTALVLLGGETIRWFAVALLFGTISGTYSSPFVAVPMFLFLKKRSKK